MTRGEVLSTLVGMDTDTAPPLIRWARAERSRLLAILEARQVDDAALYRVLGSVEALDSVLALYELDAAA